MLLLRRVEAEDLAPELHDFKLHVEPAQRRRVIAERLASSRIKHRLPVVHVVVRALYQ